MGPVNWAIYGSGPVPLPLRGGIVPFLIFVVSDRTCEFYMKYSVNAGRISSFVKIVNFVRQARAKDQICLMAVIRDSVQRSGIMIVSMILNHD